MNWKPPGQSELTPIIFNMELTQLGLNAPNYPFSLCNFKIFTLKYIISVNGGMWERVIQLLFELHFN